MFPEGHSNTACRRAALKPGAIYVLGSLRSKRVELQSSACYLVKDATYASNVYVGIFLHQPSDNEQHEEQILDVRNEEVDTYESRSTLSEMGNSMIR